MTNEQDYGSIPAADEETALIARDEWNNNEEEEELYVAPRTRNYGKGVLMTLVTISVFAVFAFSDVSPLRAQAKASGGGGTTGAPPFDWKSWGHEMKTFWADKKAQWAKQKADMKAKNATAAETKEAKHSFWNSTMPEFGDVLNTTKAAERQQKRTEAAANKAAIDEAMAEVKARRAKNGS